MNIVNYWLSVQMRLLLMTSANQKAVALTYFNDQKPPHPIHITSKVTRRAQNFQCSLDYLCFGFVWADVRIYIVIDITKY